MRPKKGEAEKSTKREPQFLGADIPYGQCLCRRKQTKVSLTMFPVSTISLFRKLPC